MRRLLALIIAGLIAFAGYLFYQQIKSGKQPSQLPRMTITQKEHNFDAVSKVLGTATSTVLNTTKSILNQATDGEAEPLINRTLENLQNEVKDLPREQYEKVKYEFCQDVVTTYQEKANDE